MTQFSKKRGVKFFFGGGVKIFFTRDFGHPSKIKRKKISPKNWTPRFFENCVIPDQYYERDLRPEVCTTSGSGCFAMAQTYIQTYTRTWRLTDQLGPVGPSW